MDRIAGSDSVRAERTQGSRRRGATGQRAHYYDLAVRRIAWREQVRLRELAGVATAIAAIGALNP
ncbi:MAG: hypothetical protein HRT86_14125 [Ilumatobacteraceae bacterium]|nr:hypothetical protein [Ilumatobacteraceae bacterium]